MMAASINWTNPWKRPCHYMAGAMWKIVQSLPPSLEGLMGNNNESKLLACVGLGDFSKGTKNNNPNFTQELDLVFLA
jgi:hypothetical protein